MLKPTATSGSLDGLSFGTGPDADGNSLVVNKWEGWYDSPPANLDAQNKYGAHGSYRGPNYRSGKSVTLYCTAHSPTPEAREAFISKIAAICGDADTLYPLTKVELTRTLTMFVELEGATKVEPRPDGRHTFFNIPLFAADPYKYTADNAAASTGLSTSPTDGTLWSGTPGNTGFEYDGPSAPFTGTVYNATVGSPGILRLTNDGTVEAPIRFAFTATVTDPKVTNLQTGQIVRWAGTVGGTSVLTMDSKTERVTIDGISVNGALTHADFFGVPPGGFVDVLYEATSGSGTQMTATNANVFAA